MNGIEETRNNLLDQYYEVFVECLETGSVPPLSLGPYAVCAWRYNQIRQEDATTYYSPLWHFTWCMRGHPDIKDSDPDYACEVIEEDVSQYFDSDIDDVWFEVFEYSEADYIEYIETWDRVEYEPGWSTLNHANELAEIYPLDVPHRKGRKYALYRRFISIAGWLQLLAGDKPILLPCEKVAHLLGCCPSNVVNLRTLAEKDGYLKMVREHEFNKNGKGRATEFHFPVDRYPGLTDEDEREVVPLRDIGKKSTSEHPPSSISSDPPNEDEDEQP